MHKSFKILSRVMVALLVGLMTQGTFANPPKVNGVKWIEVSYADIERDLLDQFAKELKRLEEIAPDIAVFAVRVDGDVPQDYFKTLRGKVEKVLLTSGKISLKDCAHCDAGLIQSTGKKEIIYSSMTGDVEFRKKIAREIGTRNLLIVNEDYNPSEMRLEMRLIDADNGTVQWTKQYTTMKLAESLNNSAPDPKTTNNTNVAQQERMMIGEIAFRAALSMGLAYFPTVNNGSGSQMIAYPDIGVSIGERYDSGYKEFGFGLGISADMSEGEGVERGKPMPFFMRFGPQFNYVFNPFSYTGARWIAHTEFGALISSGVTTAYIGAGPEVRMINRFSVSFMPMMIMKTKAKNPEVKFQDENTGTDVPIASGGISGDFGGMAILLRGNMTW